MIENINNFNNIFSKSTDGIPLESKILGIILSNINNNKVFKEMCILMLNYLDGWTFQDTANKKI